MKWISVNEELPGKEMLSFSFYLVTDGVEIGVASYYKGYFRPATVSFLSLGQNAIALVTVTHWMPLPELPKETV